MANLNDHIEIYQRELEKGDIRKAYDGLMKFMMYLKSYCSKRFEGKFSFGNVSPGRLDFTYFPFSDEYLRERKLRYGIVLNHENMRFELWLMGQNSDVQDRYWEYLRESKWNETRAHMPRYSVLEAILVEKPDFSDTGKLAEEIASATAHTSEEISGYIRDISL